MTGKELYETIAVVFKGIHDMGAWDVTGDFSAKQRDRYEEVARLVTQYEHLFDGDIIAQKIANISQKERQKLYELLYNAFGCRINK